MPNPSDIVYDLTLEAPNGLRPIRVYIKFQHETHDRYIVTVEDAITHQTLPNETPLNTQQLEKAVQLFKWAVANDPDVAPDIAEFIKSI